MNTFSVRSIDDDVFRGNGHDGVCEVIPCKKPADDGNCLFIASSPLPVDQDDAVHRMGVSLESPNSYVGPRLVYLFEVSVEKLRRNFVLHLKLNK